MPDTNPANRTLDFALRMAALLPSVRALFSTRALPETRPLWERHILAIVTEAIPADSGAVLIEDYVPEARSVPEEWIQRLYRDREPVRGPVAAGFGLAAAFVVRDEVCGLLYLERASSEYEEDHALLLSAMAHLASAALEGAYEQEWRENEWERGLPLETFLAGESPKIRELRARIARIAPTGSTVLITGESGTGKELVARALHRGSPRAGKPFVAINCAALTETLLESELFGHEKGAFTGAVAQKRGRLESGEGGTVFLDEIGEMPVSLQAKLLRVLQNREFERVGGVRTIPLNIRLIAATNRNLEEASRQGHFRQDLYYRLNVITVKTPALREHAEDIVALALRFASRFGEECGRAVRGISPEARAVLRAYRWPGNVRELENAVEHAVVLGTGDTIRTEDLPEAVRESLPAADGPQAGDLQQAINAAKRAALTNAFQQCRNDHAQAAQLLGVHPNYLYRLIRNLQMHELLKGIARE